MSSTERESSRLAAIEAATAVLEGRLDIIEGCRRLSSFAHDFLSGHGLDEDFVVFEAVASESDELPVGAERAYWDPAALHREDEEVKRAEAMYRDEVMSACRKVVSRLKAAQF